MAKLGFKIEVEGEEALRRGFYKVIETVEDFTPIWSAVKKEFFAIERELFASGGASGASGRWKPLSKAYEEQKINKYGTFALLAGTLRASDAMYKSLTKETGDTIFETDKQNLTFGSSLPQFRGAMKGNPSKNLSQRKPVDLTDADKRRISRVMRENLIPYIKKSTLIVDESNFMDVG